MASLTFCSLKHCTTPSPCRRLHMYLIINEVFKIQHTACYLGISCGLLLWHFSSTEQWSDLAVSSIMIRPRRSTQPHKAGGKRDFPSRN
ncbi:hypothetical protein CGGC5_v016944 [Colletotrichum fructicola Nara gc5]|uniref:Uncharacterized protein n=1 Tax=Colletotrichum fructicola (strain Nara gc5) TaxID=1213859 RepID=A0A7J6IE13_COLFN|nr:hypothetical protein CGGC5_v016944 [Colletotrichum fructicola Nara gc5]